MSDDSVRARALRLIKRYPGYRFDQRSLQTLLGCRPTTAWAAIKTLQQHPSVVTTLRLVPFKIRKCAIVEIHYRP